MDSTLRNYFEYDYPNACASRNIHRKDDEPYYLGDVQLQFDAYKAGYYKGLTR